MNDFAKPANAQPSAKGALYTPITPSTALTASPLGKLSPYVDQYAPSLLFPIARLDKRVEIGIDQQALPFFGADMWTAFEVSWLNMRGKPQVAIAQITLTCDSVNIIESKSLKLYLNSFNQSKFVDSQAVRKLIQQDLTKAAWQGSKSSANPEVSVRLLAPASFDAQTVQELDGLNLDRLDIDCHRYEPAPDLLQVNSSESPVSEVLVSHLLKSNCLVTGQPDWASIQIGYSGHAINQEGLLQYLVSFRNHNEFHEQCVERIFIDIWRRCQPSKLYVYARYTRRGGLDINPFRTSYPISLPANHRTARQ